MLTDYQKRVAALAIETNGTKVQTAKAIEELCELAAILARSLSQAVDASSLREEIADVIIMVEQLRCMHGPLTVDKWVQRKVERLANSLGGVT